MKRTLAIILVLVSVASCACAGRPDFTDWTFEQLYTLQHFLTAEIMSRPEWKEITVPAGEWIIGVDIPAGQYSLKSDNGAYVCVWSKGVGNYDGLEFNEIINSGNPYGKITLKDNWIIVLNDSVTFAPPIALGF